MSAPIVQADYEALDAIARRFQQQAQQTQATKQRVDRNVSALRNGGWLGQGSAAFLQEMESEVNPAVQRLIDALAEAQQVTLQVKTLIRAAEEDAANPFKVHGNEYPRAGEGALVPSGSDDGLQGLIGRIAQGVGDAISSAGNILRGAAGLLIALGIRAGNNYPGQVLIQMPKILEKLKISGRWLREQAGLARNLTHIKSTNMLRHILKNSNRIPVVGVVMGATGIAASVADTWSKRWEEYQKMGIVGGITAGAVDGAIAAIPIVAGVAGGIVGSVVGAAGGFVVGGPAGLVVVGTAGAIGVGMAGEAAGKWVARGLEGLRIRDAAVDFTTSIADRVSAMADEIGGYVSDAKVPTFGFTL